MTAIAFLPSRALVRLTGPDWASFLKGLCTAHIDELVAHAAEGRFNRLYYGAFLRPQGKMYADCLLHAVATDEIWLDVPASAREELLTKLNMYKLRAKVTIEPLDRQVFVAFGGPLSDDFLVDPRGNIVGLSFGITYTAQDATADEWDWISARMACGLAETGRDFDKDELYAIDANLDLLGAVDFHKGCYVGQELTSRMKRRGQIKNRILPFSFVGGAPEKSTEILCHDKRAGEVLLAGSGVGLAIMRLDRLDGSMSLDGGTAVTVTIPAWVAPHITTPA